MFWKKDILFSCTPEIDVILSLSDENIFFKTQGTRLSAAVAPNKRLKKL